jgi:endonuclease/exonuclease/phosphatase family metal-dependent hydrolase
MAESPTVAGVRVLTLNVWGRSGAWAARRSLIVDRLDRLRPDLVAFQEPVRADGYDQAADLLGRTYSVVYPSAALVAPGDHDGVAIGSRWPIGGVHELDLHVTPRTADFPCVTLAAEILAPEPVGPLLFVNHLPSWQHAFERERELQSAAAAAWIDELVGGRGLHVVVAGDLDADPDAASIRFWTGRQSLGGASVCSRDAWESVHPGEPGHTVTSRNPLRSGPPRPGRRIDYILVRCGQHGATLDVGACSLAFDEPVDGVWASDHFGVVADLTAGSR